MSLKSTYARRSPRICDLGYMRPPPHLKARFAHADTCFPYADTPLRRYADTCSPP
jgi:hypothetical protein